MNNNRFFKKLLSFTLILLELIFCLLFIFTEFSFYILLYILILYLIIIEQQIFCKPTNTVILKIIEIITATIIADSKPGDFTQQQNVQEMVKRDTIKTDKNDGGQKTINILLQDNSIAVINESKYGNKLTDIGNAYEYQHRNKKNSNKENTPTKTAPDITMEADTEKTAIIVPPKPGENIIIENGKAKHLLFGTYTSEGNFIASGYLTSKKFGIKISDKQYKAFEQEKEEVLALGEGNLHHIKKAQNIVKFEEPTFIKKDDIKPVKYSTQYLEMLDIESHEILNQIIQKHIGKIPFDYQDTCGLTTEDCLDICKEYDKIAEAINKKDSKVAHPISLEQKAKNKLNSQKQKEKNAYTNDQHKEVNGNEI